MKNLQSDVTRCMHFSSGWQVRCGLIVSTLNSGSRFQAQALAAALRCVIEQQTLLSQYLSILAQVNKYVQLN